MAASATASSAPAKPDAGSASSAGNTVAGEGGQGLATEPAGSTPAAAGAGAKPTSAPSAEAVAPGRGTELEFGLAVDTIYHRGRAAWFAAQHRFFLFLTIMAGSAAATDVANAKLLGLTAAAFGTLDLVLDPTTRMVEHRDFARDLTAIVGDLYRNDFSDEACGRATDEEFRVATSERAPFHAARDLAFNQAITALGRDQSHRVQLRWHRRLLANLWRFEGQ